MVLPPLTKTYFRVPNNRNHKFSDSVQGGAERLAYLLVRAPTDFPVDLLRISSASHPAPVHSQDLAF